MISIDWAAISEEFWRTVTGVSNLVIMYYIMCIHKQLKK